MDIRQSTPADLLAIAAVERACFPDDALPLITLRQYLDLFASTFLVTGDLSGFVIAGASASHPEIAWILDIAVDPKARKRGVATALLTAVLERLPQATVFATVAPHNQQSEALFARFRFARHEDVSDYFGPGERRIVMRLDRSAR